MKTNRLALTVVLMLTAVVPVFAASKSKSTIYLRATFRDAHNEAGLPSDKIRSDGKGPYANASFITAIINDVGELHFNVDANSGRRVVFIYDDQLLSGACLELPPDTAGTEPVTTAFFVTHNSTSYEEPQINLQTMAPGESGQVNVWIGFETAKRPGTFYSKYNRDYNPADPTRKGGYVIVTAIDKNGDGVVDRWILSTIPETDDEANLHRVWTGKNRFSYCDYGNFRMPFELVLDRL